MSKNLTLAAVAAVVVLLTTGCAVTQENFDALQGVVYSNQTQLRNLSQKVDRMASQMENQRRPQAEAMADLTAMRQELARLSGQIDESSHLRGGAADQMDQTLQQIDQRLAKVEKYLGIASPAPINPGAGEEAALSEPAAPAGPAGSVAPAAPIAPAAPAGPKIEDKPDKPAGPMTEKERYELGVRLYQQKSFDAARDRFEELLKDRPDGAYAASAQFWVGEVYYSQKRYEEAILAYNQVIKRYEKSPKVPGAMLKQGLAFSALGDKRTAKIVLGKLVKTYPKSSQAGIAQKYLDKME